VGEVVDEAVLEAIELECLQIVDEDDEHSCQDNADQQRQDQDHHPGPRLEELIRIELVTPDHGVQVFADAHVPVNVQKKRDRQRDDGQDEDKDRVNVPFCLFHGLHLRPTVEL